MSADRMIGARRTRQEPILHSSAVICGFILIGVGLVLPNSIAGAVGPFPRAAGAASALLGFTQMTVAAVIGVAVAALYNGSAIPMAATVATVALGVLLAFLSLVRTATRST